MSELESADDTPADRFTLSDLWAILQMQRWVVISATVVCLAVAILYSLVATRHYEAKAVVHISTLSTQEMEMGKAVTNTNLVWNRGLFISTQIAVMQTTKFRRELLERYEALGLNDGIGPNKSEGLVGGALRVTVRQGTELLDITVTTSDPELSARLANLTAELVRDEGLARTTESALDAKAWLEGQIADYSEKITAANTELLEYQRLHDMVDAGESTTLLDQRMNSLKSAYAEVNTDRVRQETMVRFHEQLLRKGQYEILAKEMESALIAALWQNYANALADHALLTATYGPKHETFQASQRRIDGFDQQFKAEAERTLAAERAHLEALMAEESAIGEAIGVGAGETLGVLGKREDYEKKRLDLENAKTFYSNMMERKGELELQAKTQLNDVRIVEDARPPKNPSSPNVWMNLLIGLGAGLTLGLGGAALREFLDDTISSPLDVSTYLRVPLLGLIPKITEKVEEPARTLYTHDHPRSNLAEAVRAMRTMIDLNPSGVSPRRLLVTSALSSEGKTSTAMRIAIAFANLNRKVLVIDADLRRPRVHRVFGGEREPGLAGVLSKAVPVADAIRPTQIPNLFYMASGKAHDRANEILASRDVPALLTELDAMFDLVIVDTPPAVILSDARILSRHVDAVVVMCKEHTTSRVLVREAIRSLQQVGATVLGVVVNEVDTKRRKPTSYYGYSYGYGYRYERYDQEDEQSDAAAK